MFEGTLKSLLSLLAAALLASGCTKGSAPAGVTADAQTGLRWSSCALGQTWQDGRCAGDALLLNLNDAQARVEQLNTAKYLGITQWRLPNIIELAALRHCDNGLTEETFTLGLMAEQEPIEVKRWCAGETSVPTIDTKLFPDTPLLKFWSSSGSEVQQTQYAVNFANAWIGMNEAAEETYAVRPVADRAAP